jgi:hypothetical protein
MTPTQKLQQIKNWIFSWSSQHSFKRMTDDKGNQFEVDGELELGKELYSVTTEGLIVPTDDGEYEIDGKVLNIIDGIIKSVISGNRVITENQINKEENKKETMAENVKMVSDALVDGTEISISGDSIVAGADVRIIKDGQELLPPAGEHKLKSGSIIIVDENGKITEVKSEEPKVEVEIEAAEEVKPKEDVKDTGVKSVEEMVKQVMEAVMEMKQKMADMEKDKEKMKEEFAAFKKEPAAEPLKRNSKSAEYQFGSGDSPRVQMLEALRGHLKNK